MFRKIFDGLAPQRTHQPRGDRFAALDFETTGFWWGGNDRVIEVGIAVFTLEGAVVEEYTSLIRPGRDLGPAQIHGISAAELSRAPTFGDVVGDVGARLKGATIVAHNAPFDLGFLEAELRRLSLPLPPTPYVCSMSFARRLGLPCQLTRACQAVGVRPQGQHTALGDARATASLFSALCSRQPAWASSVRRTGSGGEWPDLPPGNLSLTRTAAHDALAEERGYLSSLIARLPHAGSSDEAAAYLDVLDRALEDRILTRQEAKQLFDVARAIGLGASEVSDAHRAYFASLVKVAWDDGRLSSSERDDLLTVGELLRIESSTIMSAMRRPVRSPVTVVELPQRLNVGMSVCFTGQLRCTFEGEEISRELAEHIALSKGLLVKSGVSKKLDVLVAADAESESTKARKARAYGTRIMAESVFWSELGVPVD